MIRSRRSHVLPLLLVPLLAVAACGDDTVEPSGVDFDALEAALDETLLAFELSAGSNQFIADALVELEAFGVQFDPAASPIRPQILAGSAALVAAAPLDVVAPERLQPNVVFPPAALGQVFVYDADTDAWQIAEDRTGAPTNGIRVIWYEVDGTGTPLPTEELGWFDLTDEDADGLSILGVTMVSTETGSPVTLADYTVGYRQDQNGTTWSEEFVAGGYFLDDAGTRLDFDFSGTGSGDDATGAETYTFDLNFDTPELSYGFDLDQNVAGSGTSQEAIDIQVVHDGATTRLQLTLSGDETDSSGSGTLRHQGALVADITSVDGDISYSRPGGGSFSAADTARLDSVVATLLLTGFYVLYALPLLYV